jgi:hypothetical protein
MEAIQFTEEQRRWAETSLQLGTIAKSLSGKQEEATNNNFIGESLIKNGYFDQTIPGSKSPILGNELIQNGNFEEKGAELVTNGDFSTDSDWTEGAGWDIDEVNNRITRTAQSGSTSASQDVSFVSGKSYIITYTLDVSAGSFLIRLGGDGVKDTPARSVDGTYTEVVNASGNYDILNLRASDGTFAGSISNVSVRQLDTNNRWTIGSGWSLGDGYAENSTSASSSSYLQSDNITLTNGALYQIQFDLDIISATTTTIGLSGTGAFGQIDTSDRFFTTSGTKTIEAFYSSSKPNYLRFVGGANTNYKVTNISLKLIEAVDIDLWETVTNSLDSTIVFSNGFVTLDYDGTDGSLAIRQSDILTINDNYTVVVDYQMISGEAKALLGATAVTLNSSTRVTQTFNAQCTSSDDFAIARKTEGQAMKMVVYSVAVYKIDNSDWTLGSNWSIDRGQGLKGSGAGNNNAVQSFTAVATKTYRVEYKISSYTQGSVRVQIGGTNGTANASVGTFIENVVATNTGDISVQNVQVGSDNFIGTIEYIKIQSGEQSDTLDMTDPAPKALWIVAPGNLKVTTMAGDVTTINDLEADTFIDWLRIKKVWLTGTTITDIIGIY